jgi:hypothetical protein
MFRIVGSSVSIVIVMNFMALTLLSLLLGWFSAPIFGLAFFVIGFFVLLILAFIRSQSMVSYMPY